MAPLSPSAISKALPCSLPLAAAASLAYKSFNTSPPSPALFAFAGVAFKSLDARSLPPPAVAWCARSLLVFCPVHGLLRAGDEVREYRMELGHKLPLGGGESRPLAKHWRTVLSAGLAADVPGGVLLDASSQEYGRSLLDLPLLNAAGVSVATVAFRQGGRACGSVHAKQSRGLFARWCAENGVGSVVTNTKVAICKIA
jgi:cytoplasmic iron level regulating protein YaaA (DUF328/UPF0246 family)